MINAVIFDLDGLMVDSTPLQREASQKFLESKGKFHFTPKGGREGMRMIDIVEEYKDIYELPEPIEDLYRERQTIYYQLVREKLQLFPDLLPLVEKLRERGLKLAIATSGDREYVHVLFTKFPELKIFFPIIITSEDVLQGKPHPEVFLKAAKKLAVDPTTCVVLEDSFNGILAAKAAGMQVICIPNKHYPAADYSRADKVFASLSEVSAALN